MDLLFRNLIKVNSIYILTYLIISTTEAAVGYESGYQIKESRKTTYLNYTFTNLPETIFPADIIIELSVSRMAGTLLYSVDSNNNQMIVSLTDGTTTSLKIEFGTEEFYFPLSKLCYLEYTRFVKLKLRIQMRESMYVQCNDGIMESAKYQLTGQFNKAYPIPKFPHKTDKLQAYMWLVNTPSVDGIYSNSDQLSGCIFKVLYKKEPLNMSTYNVGGKCPTTCTANICNSGHCLETHNTRPICNCTSSFYNGPNCNDALREGSYVINEEHLFKAIKLVFISSQDEILGLHDTTVHLRLWVKDKSLIFTIEITKPYLSKIHSTITDKYEREDMHLIIFLFSEHLVDVKYYTEKSSWLDIRIRHNHDISRVLFTKKIFNGDKIDLSYKNDFKELLWNEISYKGKQTTIISTNTTTTATGSSVIRSTTSGLQNKTLEATKKLSNGLKEDEIVGRNVLINSDQKKLDTLLLLVSFILGLLIIAGIVYVLMIRFRKRNTRDIKNENRDLKLYTLMDSLMRNSRNKENEHQHMKLYTPSDSLMRKSRYIKNGHRDLIKDKSMDLLI